MGNNNDNFCTGPIPDKLKEIIVYENSVNQYKEGDIILFRSKKFESIYNDRYRFYIGKIFKIYSTGGPVEKTYIVKCVVFNSTAILEFYIHYSDILKKINGAPRRLSINGAMYLENVAVFDYYNCKDIHFDDPKFKLDETVYVKYTDDTKYIVFENNLIDTVTFNKIYLIAPEDNKTNYVFVTEDELFRYHTAIKHDNDTSYSEESKYKVDDIVDVSDKDIFAKITKIKVTNVIEIDGEIYYKFEPISCNIDFCKLSE